jgi:hypothetical protein
MPTWSSPQEAIVDRVEEADLDMGTLTFAEICDKLGAAMLEVCSGRVIHANTWKDEGLQHFRMGRGTERSAVYPVLFCVAG